MTSHPTALLEYLERHREDVADTAGELLAFDTQNPPGETRAIVDWLEDRFASLGLPTERVATDPAKPNLVATLDGESERIFCLNGHVDTVAFDPAEWAHDPLGERVDEHLYGRGATDMKGALAAMLATARAYAKTDTTPPVTLVFAVVSDEEVGGEAGLPTLLESGFSADACVIGESTCERGRHSVTVADRGSIWLTLEATGGGAHGSRPMLGTNAIDRLYEAVALLRERFGTRALDVDATIEPIIEESVAYYEPTMGAQTARDLFEYPTINLGTIAGGDAINSVPTTATAEIDVRLTAGVETADVLADVRACADDCEGVTISDVSWSVGSAELIDSPLVDSVASVAEAVTGDRVYRRSATGGGDAKTLRHAGIPTVEFALGTDTVHAVDEYTTLDVLQANATVYTRLPYAYAEQVTAE